MASPADEQVLNLLNTLTDTLPGTGELLLGFSGGLDSTVLLHALVRAGFAPRLRAVHVNHGLHDDALRWQALCQQHCEALGIELEVVSVALADGANLEARARQARYQAIDELRRPGEALVLAHHRDDQAETILFRLLRGAGVPALAGMKVHSERQGLSIWRPLLSVPRHLLEQVAALWQLKWVEDPANAAERFDRNYLRHRALPLLSARWPAAERLVQAGQQFAEAGELLDALAEADAVQCQCQGQSLALAPLAALSPARRRNLLSWWLRQAGRSLPDRQLFERVDTELLAAQTDRNPLLRWPQGAFARHAGRLWWLAPEQLEPLPQRTLWHWREHNTLALPPVCSLRLAAAGASPDQSLALVLPDGQAPLTVARARGGERLLMGGMHRQVSELWRVAGVPVWQRARLPLLYQGDTLLAVAAIGVADDCRPQAGGDALCIAIEPQ